MAAGLAQLEILEKENVYAHINSLGEKLGAGLKEIIRNTGVKACVNHIGSLVCLFFRIEEAENYQSVKRADTALYALFFHELLNKGIYIAPSQFEAMFISYAHTQKDIDETLNKAEQAIQITAK